MIKSLAKLIIKLQITNALSSSGLFGEAIVPVPTARGISFAEAPAPGLMSEPGFIATTASAAPRSVGGYALAGDGGDTVVAAPVNVQVNNYTDSSVSEKSMTSADGARMIKIEVRNQIKASMSDGSMDKIMKSSYGASRQPARGGP